jgi:hypothetical protein
LFGLFGAAEEEYFSGDVEYGYFSLSGYLGGSVTGEKIYPGS